MYVCMYVYIYRYEHTVCVYIYTHHRILVPKMTVNQRVLRQTISALALKPPLLGTLGPRASARHL